METTTSVAADINPSTYGEQVTYTVTVQAGDPLNPIQTPSGTVSVFDNDNLVGSQDLPPLPDTSASVSFDICFLSVGAHEIRAEYSGASGGGYDYAASSGSLTQTVNKISTTLTITGPATAYLGEPYTVTGTISPVTQSTDCGGTLSPTGTVSVSDGYGGTCAANLQSGGTWQCGITSSSAAVTQLTATYEGDAFFAGSADTHAISVTERPKTATSISLASSKNPSTYGDVVAFTATVTPKPSGGTVAYFDGGTQLATSPVDPVTGTAVFSTGALSVGTHAMTAKYSGNEEYAASPTSNTVTQVVNPIATTTTLVSDKSTAAYQESITLTAAVTRTTGGTPVTSGTITFKDGTTEIATAPVGDSGEAFLATSSLAIGVHTITATYTSAGQYATSTSAPLAVLVVKRTTETTIVGSDTPLVVGDTATFTIAVTDTSPGIPSIPGGEVTVTIVPADEGSMSPSSPLTLDDAGRATFAYAPDRATTPVHIFIASYEGDATHQASDATSPTTEGAYAQVILKRAIDVTLICSPVDAYIHQEIECTVILSDDTTAGTPSVPDEAYLTLSDDRWSGPTRFSSVSWSTVGSDRVGTFTYTPAAWDTVDDQSGDPPSGSPHSQASAAITATFAGSPEHSDASTMQAVTIRLRPTEATVDGPSEHLLVYQAGEFTASVADAAGVGSPTDPGGILTFTATLEPVTESLILPAIGAAPSASFTYVRLSLGFEGEEPIVGAFDILQVEYLAADGIHANCGIGFAQAVIRRPTETTLSGCACYPAVEPNPGGVLCFVSVADHVDNAPPAAGLTLPAPAGDLRTMNDDDADGVIEYEDVGDAPTAPITGTPLQFPSDLILTNVTVQYDPSDGVYQRSTGSENVPRSLCMPDPGTAPGDATSCSAGCGEGGVNVHAIIDGLNASCLAANAGALALDAIMLAFDPTPDPIIGAGFIVITGTTIPTSDIAATIAGVAKLALAAYSLTACTDSDSDGIPDVVELGTTHTDPYSRNTDKDAMGDADEIGYCAGYYGGTLRPNPNEPDSDFDGILDGYELAPFSTDLCVADTDCDTLPDGIEIACRIAPLTSNGFCRGDIPEHPTDTFAALGYAGYVFPGDFADPRDQPNPREGDTDGDGLRDDIEFGPGDLVEGAEDPSDLANYSPYVNDADSDDDGLQDGIEDSNRDGAWGIKGGWPPQIGSTGSVGAGETHLCMADTDGDGLLDGEEEALFGRGPTTVHSTLGTVTTPALDDDSDDDGLSDYEEQVVTHTNPLHWDSDGDGLSDADELIVTGGAFPNRTFDQESDPLDSDTDDDGLGDKVEYYDPDATFPYGSGVIKTSTLENSPGHRDTRCPYVDDDDSDDDGLQDGHEDADHDGVITSSRGGSTTEGSGETHYCRRDDDTDGLLDGEEEGLFGPGEINAVTPTGVVTTVAALDSDMDNDYLDDEEEVNVYNTDPRNWDTDGDGVPDSVEIATWDSTIFSRLNSSYSEYAGQVPENPLQTYFDLIRISGGASEDSRNHADPNADDTDGDGLTDDLELAYDCNCGTGTDGYVNDDDSDDDGLQDGREYELFGTGADLETAGTGATAANDGELGTDIVCCLCDPDSDDDGLSDGEEEHIGTNPLDWDSDDDGLSDREEIHVFFTDPSNADTDGDGASGILPKRPTAAGLPSPGYNGSTSTETYAGVTFDVYDILLGSDGEEALSRTGVYPFGFLGDQSDPLSKDTDGDAIQDDIEFPPGCNCSGEPGASEDGFVNDSDSDDDGIQDGSDTWPDVAESNGNDGELDDDLICSLCDPDSDGDGLSDGEEIHIGTDPLDWDSDDDGLSDLEELQIYFTDPNNDDTDGDGADGNIEARDPAVEPALPGHSGNGAIAALSDCEEAFSGTDYPPFGNPLDETDPLQRDTDGDGLGDEVEFKVGCSCTTTDWCDCPVNPIGWTYADPNFYGVVYDPIRDGYANDSDSDEDGLRDGEDVHEDLVAADVAFPGKVFTILGEYCADLSLREQRDDTLHSICDPDSDGDGLLDGEEFAIGTDWLDWDTDDDGRNDWHEHTGGEQVTNADPIPTDPFDPDTDDDGLLDSAEVFGLNNTNPLNADTDGDGLCDGGTGTPYMLSGDPTVHVNPICKSCAVPGFEPPCDGPRGGSVDGIGDHPNSHGYGEDKNGNGTWEPGGYDYWGDVYTGDETDPNQYDTDGDGEGDGVEVLGFSTSRQNWIPTADLFDRPINVVYPECGCLDPLDPDTDDDQLEDGYEDRNHDGNFDFLPSEFDHYDPLPGPPIPYPTETNPCDADTDHDELTDYEERYQSQVFALYADWDNDGDGLYNEDPFVDGIDEDLDGLDGEDPLESPFNPTNPLDHDTDNDWILDGPEVMWECVELAYFTLDNDTDGLTDEDPLDGVDNDGDGLIDEDPIDYWVRFVPMLDPTNRDSDFDGYIDGLDDDPCNSELIPLLAPVTGEPVDTDSDGFSDDDEMSAGTHPNDPDDHPIAYAGMNLDLDECFDDRLWLEPAICCGVANAVVIDINSDLLADIRVQIVQPYDASIGDYDGDGFEDDAQYAIEYAFALYRAVQRRIVMTIYDYDMDLAIDAVELERR